MPLGRRHRAALISIFSCLSCQIVLRFYLLFFFNRKPFAGPSSPWWNHPLIVVLLRACEGFLLTRGLLAPLLHAVENTLMFQKMKCLSSKVLVTAVLRDGFPAASPRTWQTCKPSAAQDNTRTHPDFPWNLNQETFERVPPAGRLPHSKGGDIVALFHRLKGEIPGIELVCWSGSRLECVSGPHLLWGNVGSDLFVYWTVKKQTNQNVPSAWNCHQSGLIFLLDQKFPVLTRKYSHWRSHLPD